MLQKGGLELRIQADSFHSIEVRPLVGDTVLQSSPVRVDTDIITSGDGKHPTAIALDKHGPLKDLVSNIQQFLNGLPLQQGHNEVTLPAIVKGKCLQYFVAELLGTNIRKKDHIFSTDKRSLKGTTAGSNAPGCNLCKTAQIAIAFSESLET